MMTLDSRTAADLTKFIKCRKSRHMWENRGNTSQGVSAVVMFFTFLTFFVENANFSTTLQVFCMALAVLSWIYTWYCIRSARAYSKSEAGIHKKLSNEVNHDNTNRRKRRAPCGKVA